MLAFVQSISFLFIILGFLIVAATSVLVYSQRSVLPWVPILPPSIILEAALATDRLTSSKIVKSIRFILRHGHAFFSIHHEILPDLPYVEKLLLKRDEIFNLHPMRTSMMTRIPGCDVMGLGREGYAFLHDNGMKLIARDFVNAVATTAILQRSNIEGNVSSMISFTDKVEFQKKWEQVADVKVLNPNRGSQARIAEVNLESFLKALNACISIAALYGHDYIERYPSFIQDWNYFTTYAIPLLVFGIPSWIPIKSFQRGVAARRRLIDSIISLYQRLRNFENSENIGKGADMSHVSQSTIDRFKLYEQQGVSLDMIGKMGLSFIWAQNANTEQLLFWIIFYIYSTPGLLESLRQEVASSGAIAIATPADKPSVITELDIAIIGKECPLLKSTFIETFRLVEESVLFRKISERVTLDDGVSQRELPPGSWVSISTCLAQHDASIYPRPIEFVPDRFINDSVEGKKKTASYKTLRPWGLGPAMCKGRTFAEKQLLAVAASIITLWDMEPITVSGKWEHPGFKAGATIVAANKNVRVCIERRRNL